MPDPEKEVLGIRHMNPFILTIIPTSALWVLTVVFFNVFNVNQKYRDGFMITWAYFGAILGCWLIQAEIIYLRGFT